MPITIEIIHSNNLQQLLTLYKPVFVIGRSDHCDVQLRDDVVSSTHAKIRVYRDHIVIEDLGSTNGLFVDGARVSGEAEIGLHSTVELGPGGPKLRIVDGLPKVASLHRAGTFNVSSRTGKPFSFLLVVVGVVICFLLLMVGVSSVGLVTFLVHNKSSSNAVTSKKDEVKLSDAVAFVINGYELVTHEGKKVIPASTGSAFVVSPNGYLVTNCHVVEQDDCLKNKLDSLPGVKATHRIWIVLHGDLVDADVLYSGTEYDLGILQVSKTQLPFFRLSLDDALPRSSTVFAVGFPGAERAAFSAEEQMESVVRQSMLTSDIKTYFKARDFDFTLTNGAVTRLTRESNGRNWITHDTVISGGNSGGPLCLEANGVVVGINTEADPSNGISVSLSMPQLRTIIDRYVPDATWIKP